MRDLPMVCLSIFFVTVTTEKQAQNLCIDASVEQRLTKSKFVENYVFVFWIVLKGFKTYGTVQSDKSKQCLTKWDAVFKDL